MARTKKRKSVRRPSRKQLAARRKFIAMARARSRAARQPTRTRKRSPVMPKRRRRKATTVARRRRPRRTGTMRSVVRGGRQRTSWRASGYRRNPVRRGRRRRNPVSGIAGEVMELGKQTVAVMAGRFLGRTLSGMIPFGGDSPYLTAAKGVAVAYLIKRFGRKVVSADLADALAIGALLQPAQDLIMVVAPSAGAFLSGGYAFPTFPSGRIGTYALGSYGGAGSSETADDSSYIGSYSADYPNQA